MADMATEAEDSLVSMTAPKESGKPPKISINITQADNGGFIVRSDVAGGGFVPGKPGGPTETVYQDLEAALEYTRTEFGGAAPPQPGMEEAPPPMPEEENIREESYEAPPAPGGPPMGQFASATGSKPPMG